MSDGGLVLTCNDKSGLWPLDLPLCKPGLHCKQAGMMTRVPDDSGLLDLTSIYLDHSAAWPAGLTHPLLETSHVQIYQLVRNSWASSTGDKEKVQ